MIEVSSKSFVSRTLSARGLSRIISFLLLFTAQPLLLSAENCFEKVTAKVHLELQHLWRPPFGLERVAQQLVAVVEVTSVDRPYREYSLSALVDGKAEGAHLEPESTFVAEREAIRVVVDEPK
jgi:hypothetical protein